MPASPTFLHRTHRPWGMVLAVLALCMQLWAGQATAAHFGQAMVDGTWRNDLCRTENTPGLDPHTLQALCISEHCPACSVAGSKPLPPSAAGVLNAAALHNAPPCSDGQNQHSISTRLRPPAQAPPAMPPHQALAAATPLPPRMTLHTSS